MITDSASSYIQQVVAATLDPILRESVQGAIQEALGKVSHAEIALERLTRFVEASRVPSTLLSQWERAPELLETLLQCLDITSPAVEWLIDDPDGFDALRLAAGTERSADELSDRLRSELRCLEDASQARLALKRFRKRELLRVLFGTELHGLTLARAQLQLTAINDAIIGAAYAFAFRDWEQEGIDHGPLAILAIDSLGAEESDFVSPCPLLCFSFAESSQPAIPGHRVVDELECQRGIAAFQELLNSFDPSSFSVGFPVQREWMGASDRLVHDARKWLEMAQLHGDLECREALLRARSIAGNKEAAAHFLQVSQAFVFERYRTRSEQSSLASYFRKRERVARSAVRSSSTELDWEVLLESAQEQLQSACTFLQWIYGADLNEVRVASRCEAMEALAQHGCLTDAEFGVLSQTLASLREVTLRQQIETGCSRDSLDGDRDGSGRTYQEQANKILELRPKLNAVWSHLRGSLLDDDGAGSEEADLILDPNPDREWAHGILSKYRFLDLDRASHCLRELATEDFQVLSTRRCQYFLSVIATKLLERIGQTPSPDSTLENLVATCRSIGAKGVLWELFSLHQPSMELYVRMCGASPYLVGILTSNPGMVDELLDSLMVGRLPSQEQLSGLLDELCRGAEEPDSIVRSFKNAMHLTIGVRDILGKESISETHRTLASVAEVCLQQLVEHHFNGLAQRYGIPTLDDGRECRFAVLAIGKLGSREPNYHSDVTVLFVYEGAGRTRPMGPTRHPECIGNEFFFHQLAQRFAQGVNRLTKQGRLYELKNWILGRSTATLLAWELHALEERFLSGKDDTEDRWKLTTARTIAGDPEFQSTVQQAVHRILHQRVWSEEDTQWVLSQRAELERTASDRNIKRGHGGTMDVEVLAQVLSARESNRQEQRMVPGTIDSIEQLRRSGRIANEDALQLKDAYNYLRGVESGLRLMNTKARHDLPSDPTECARLAYGLHLPDAQQLEEMCAHFRNESRRLLVQYLGPMPS